ncbi:MAG: bifunctional hydroxymethylpyrimidine kinase/phosphomethylpyrimidine kinase [Proteobacteria bacterium]|nr:bifunctional hydroxymethylpyrimidine kinase/phosphomethylpyrimidine kinase [Pseudomonadota bacterium]
MAHTLKGRVLIIAGSDPSGGAGIQADIKACTAMGAYAMTAITALTAQDTNGVTGVHEVPETFIAEQIKLCLDDIGADTIKTGMLHRASVIQAVFDATQGHGRGIPLVLDPVMVAKGGSPLLQKDAVHALQTLLIPIAALITPNIPEAELLSGMTIETDADMKKAGQAILKRGAKAVLMKGGHREGAEVTDILLTEGGAKTFRSPRIKTRQTHGTGCTLASAIAASLAQGMALETAVERARNYVWNAINTAPGYGSGHGPLNHLADAD